MSQKPKWIVLVEGAGKAVGLVAVLNGALIILTDPRTPLGSFSRGTWTFFFETYEECLKETNLSAEGKRECSIKHGVPL